MGNYSFYDYGDLDVTDMEGLKEWIEKVKTTKVYTDENFNYEDYKLYWERLILDDETVSFEDLTDMKLVGYWYDSFVTFLRDIACFIEGTVQWTYETLDLSGRVEFEDGKCIIETGSMEWTSHKAETFTEMPTLPKEITARLTARKI